MTILRAAELFAGGGGLAVGLRSAGFKTVAAIELNADAAATFSANHPDVCVIQQDVRMIKGDTLLSLANGSLDLLVACPPCQGFSSLTSKWRRSDPRNELVREVARLAEETLPRAVMVENVPGLVTKGSGLFEDLIQRLTTLGYRCNWSILQVADFGVPQRRRRLVLLAGLNFEIELPKPTHSRAGRDGLPLWRTLKDTLGGLPRRAPTWSEIQTLGGPKAVNWHVTRSLSPANIRRLQHSKPGGMRMDLPDDMRPRCHRGSYDGFRNAYGRLSWSEPSATITAGCLSLSKGRFGHPDQNRTISLREAALLQTFPEDYRFETRFIDRAAEIVGNALPCLFAAAVAASAAAALRQEDAAG